MNSYFNKMTQSQWISLIENQNSLERTSNWCVETAPVPDCGGIGIAFVEQHIADNRRERDVDNLPYGLSLISAVIKQAIADYEDALFNWLTNHKQLGELGEPYVFLSDWADVLGVSIEWMEDIMREEVYKKIKRKERINGRSNNHLR